MPCSVSSTPISTAGRMQREAPDPGIESGILLVS
jgi:hypothetical protein